MKTILQITVAAGAMLAAVVTPLVAAPPSPSESAVPGSSQSGIILRGSDVMNAKVFSQEGEELGHIRDVLLDPQSGNISFAVLGKGGWQGIGETYLIVPWNLVKQDEQKADNYVLQAPAEKIKGAPTFERDQWATVIQPNYLSKVQSYFSSPGTPQQASAPAAPPSPASPPSDVQATQKTPPEPEQKQQAQQRQRKESQQAEQKQKQSSGARVGTEQ